MKSELWYTEEYTEHIRFSYRVTDLLLRKQTSYQLLEILETPEFGRLMLLDGKVMVTQRDEHIYHEMLVHPAMLAHPKPEKVLVIGGGDGGSIREIVRHKDVKKAVLAEIDDEVIEASKRYFPKLTSGLSDPRVQLQIGDAAAFVADAVKFNEKYDICFIDCTDVAGPGPVDIASSLITDEFLDNINTLLSPNGIMVAQSETPVYSIDYLKRYVKRLSQRFTYVASYVIMVPSYAGLWSLTWASESVDPNTVISRKAPEGIRYFSPGIFKGALEMGKVQFWEKIV